jgi:hypothetical protein
MPRERQSPAKNDWAPGTATAWKKRGGPHRITLPSGQRVLARVLGMASLSRLEALPEDLTDAVVLHVVNLEHGGLPAVIGAELGKVTSDPEVAARVQQRISDFARLTKHAVAEALVEPTLTVKELEQIPPDDLEMLMRIVTGRQPFDAAGVRIGVEPIDAWATFPSSHQCPADCEACKNALAALSSVDVGDV